MTLETVLMAMQSEIRSLKAKVAEHDRRIIHAPLHADTTKVTTIASGAITASRPNIALVPESGTSDELNTINNPSDGKMVILSAGRDGDTITVNDYTVGAGNIHLSNGETTAVLSNTHDSLIFIYRLSEEHWEQVAAGGAIPVVPATTDDLPEGMTNLYYTDERAQDAVGTILTDGNGIDLSYDDVTPAISADLTTLTSDWDIGEDRAIKLERIQARDDEGINFYNSSGVLHADLADNGKLTAAALDLINNGGAGIYIEDTGDNSVIYALRVMNFDSMDFIARLGSGINPILGLTFNEDTENFADFYRSSKLAYFYGPVTSVGLLTASSGVTFGQDTLSVYDEVLFSPTLTFGGGSTGMTFSTQQGACIKVGGLVYASVRLVLTNKGSSTGTAVIGNFPYAFNYQTVPSVLWRNMATNWVNITAAPSGFSLTLQGANAAAAANNTNLTHADFNNNSEIRLNAVYI